MPSSTAGSAPSLPSQRRLSYRTRRNAVPVRHGRLKARKPYATIFKLMGATLAVAMVSGAGVVAYAVVETVSAVKPGIHLAAAPGQSAAPAPEIGAVNGAVDLLLTGTDTRTGQGGAFSSADELAGSSGAGSNDVTMVLHISADHNNATVVSIPRDLMAPIPECPTADGGTTSATSNGMFNTTLSRGGLSCVVLTAEALTGLRPRIEGARFDT